MEYKIKKEITKLWNLANTYETIYISGSAPSLLATKLSEALFAGKTNQVCEDVKAWQLSIWDMYYTEKTKLEAGEEYSTDFSVLGEIPHSIPEIMASTCE